MIDDKVKLLDSSTWSCFKSLQPNPLINPAAKQAIKQS